MPRYDRLSRGGRPGDDADAFDCTLGLGGYICAAVGLAGCSGGFVYRIFSGYSMTCGHRAFLFPFLDVRMVAARRHDLGRVIFTGWL